MSPTLTVGRLTEDELVEVLRLDALVYGHELDDARIHCFTEFLDAKRLVGARYGTEIVATHAVVGQRITVPGGRELDLAGFTWVAVHPLFQRRGLMNELTRTAFELVSEPIAGGLPHNSRSHQRYGFGPATRCAAIELMLNSRRQLQGVPEWGSLEYLGWPQWLPLVRQITGQLVRRRNGWLPRKPCLDEYKYSRAAHGLGEFGPTTFVAHRDPEGELDGCLSYRLAAGADERGRPQGVLRVIELLGTSAESEAQLWQHCIGNPLVDRIVASRRPVTDPIVFRLPDPRAWRQTIQEDVYLSVVDVPTALAARCYAREDEMVLEVRRPDGRSELVALVGGLEGAECRRVERSADLSVSVTALASAYLGDIPLDLLADAGEVVEFRPGSLRRAAAMFSWSQAPWVAESF